MLLLLLAVASIAQAQVQVRTLGGGRTSPTGPDAGYVDGNTLQSSQFNFPAGVVVDLAGNLIVADRDNGAIRKLDLAANRSSTILSGLDKPIAVALDATNNLYILTRGDGLLRRIDRFGIITTNKARFSKPTALALSGQDSMYVTEEGGNLVSVNLAEGTRSLIRSDLKRPSGIAVLESGALAVSDTDRHRILLSDAPCCDVIGTGIAGFRDGPAANAQFDQPHHLARAPDGSLVVADRGNHRVRLIRPDGVVTTLYGVNSDSWEGPECLTCNPIILPGWFDGNPEFAEAREPMGIAVSREGKVFATESYYHLVREVTGAALSAEPGSGSISNLVVLPPVITPDSGYYPLGQDIVVINPNTNAFFNHAVYYTTDGVAPTTNSLRLALSNNSGTIHWRETARDLASLRVVAFAGTRASEVTRGKPVATNEIGLTRDLDAGAGSTIVLPISVNLRPQDELKSLQFRVEVSPVSASTPPIPERFRALTITTNDFIPYVTSAQTGGAASFGASPYSLGQTRGLAITYLGADSGFSMKNFGVAAMVAVPIPADLGFGALYRIDILAQSGTSDGHEAQIRLAPMAARHITIRPTGYIVGDSSPAHSYNAPTAKPDSFSGVLALPDFGPFGFGDQRIDNSDVNNAFEASLGIRVPYPFTDLFDAMDAFPEDTRDGVGGDGLIRFLDWQLILRRSLGLDTSRWVRFWSSGGVRSAFQHLPAPNLPAATLKQSPPGGVWLRHALLTASLQENVSPGVQTDVPVFLTVAAGFRVAGLAFHATLQPEAGVPPVQQPVRFIPAAGLPDPIRRAGSSASDLLCGWPLLPASGFEPSLQARTLLGHFRFTLPNAARAGQSYTLRFAHADGAPDLRTQYDFETRPASIWVQSVAQRKPEIISDEWKVQFFGSYASASAQPDADPDHDGLSNLDEYFAGTNPASASSALRLEAAQASNRAVLRWVGAPGRSFALEAAASLQSPDWKAIALDLPGTGAIQEFDTTAAPATARFFRLRLQSGNFRE